MAWCGPLKDVFLISWLLLESRNSEREEAQLYRAGLWVEEANEEIAHWVDTRQALGEGANTMHVDRELKR